MCAALRQRNVGDGQGEEDLDWKLQPRRDAQRTHSQLAPVVREADEPARDEPGDRGPRPPVPGECGEQPAHDPEGSEQNATSGGCARLPLVALGELRLDHLARLHPVQHADRDRIEDERDSERDRECRSVEDHLVSSFTTSSSPALCDPFTSTLSPRRALFVTHITAASRSATRCAPAASASTLPSSLSRTATASNSSAARRPTRWWDSMASVPSSNMGPSTANSRPCRGRSASVSNAATIDSGLAL